MMLKIKLFPWQINEHVAIDRQSFASEHPFPVDEDVAVVVAEPGKERPKAKEQECCSTHFRSLITRVEELDARQPVRQIVPVASKTTFSESENHQQYLLSQRQNQ